MAILILPANREFRTPLVCRRKATGTLVRQVNNNNNFIVVIKDLIQFDIVLRSVVRLLCFQEF